MSQWYEGAAGRSRLQADLDMVAGEFPSLELTYTKTRKYAILKGTIAVNIGSRHEIIREAPVSVMFPSDYPNVEPDGFISEGTFAAHPGKMFADRHMTETGWCCLELPADSLWDANDPDALRKWLTNFVFFVHRQFLYDINGGIWPGPEWEHGDKGWAQFILEKIDTLLIPVFMRRLRESPYQRHSPCPCGSTNVFAQCHKRDLDHLLKQLPNDPKRHRKIAEILEQSALRDGDNDLEEAI
jgi:hypothetical protein